MKKFIKWIKSPASDFALFVIVLVLANLVASRAFIRIDLTEPKSYSLSNASRQLVKTLNEPLSVQVFFSSNLPAPYNSVEQYVSDILVEYKNAANGNFSYRIHDMDKEESQALASGYGLHQVQIREIANNEVGFKQAWMGVAIIYADAIKTIDSLTSSDGFEYKLTTAVSKMIATADSLALLPKDDKIKLKLYVSQELGDFRIGGFDQLDQSVKTAFDAFNRRNQNRIDFEKISPKAAEVEPIIERYGIQSINWQTQDGNRGTGVLGLVLEHGDSFRLIPLSMQRSLFGYALIGLDTLEDSLSAGLQSLVSKSMEIGYITGHEEASLDDSQTGAGLLSGIVSEMYTFKEINLSYEDIPVNISAVLVNGPKSKFSDAELYKLDQFIMRGGNVMFFLDPFNNISSYGQQPVYLPIETGLSKLFDSYGIKTGHDYILDENCYTQQNQPGYGKINLYFAPLLQKENFANHPITKNLGYVIFLQNGSIDVTEAEKNKDVKITYLAKSSPKSWLMKDRIDLNPMSIYPPSDKSVEKAENLAVLLEGKFKSAFDAEVNPDDQSASAETEISAKGHLAKSIQGGKIFISGSSAMLTPQLIDENGTEPVAMFVKNSIDYMNGNEELCTMRTKGLSLNVLNITNKKAVAAAKYFNQFGLAVLIALAGLLVWQKRSARRNAIRNRYDPDDTRTVSKSKKGDAENDKIKNA
ncbi:Gldg family protein [Treponema parvum]|uniref:Gldg family protein n=1 Tax=Treponema parvum TaxID=138851 RepID=A0A975F2X9_9SPIR|nr:Gldg family protein [Treponema parvum]QTQ13401.1 Gldg family protein [Treponema parvum]